MVDKDQNPNRLRELLRSFWKCESGVLSGIDYLITMTIVVIGTMIGIVVMRDAIIQQFGDIGVALENVSQTYSVNVTFAGGGTYQASFTDGTPPTDTAGNAPGGISLEQPVLGE